VAEEVGLPLKRAILTRIAGSPAGKRVLNTFSQPHGVYTSFAEGWAAARKTSLAGHEDPNEVKIHLRLAESLRPSDYAALYWISRIQPRSLKLFDYGGSVGNLYYSYSPYLRGMESVEWTVFEIPNVVETGRDIAADRKAAGLRFVEGVDSFRAEQILLVSGAFHYWEQDIPGFVKHFGEAPQHIIINRSPVHETQASFITVQGTASAAFPCKVWNSGELLSGFAACGYQLIDRWRAWELSVHRPFFPAYSVPHYSGFYFSRTDAV
jgi:putative methyltransferase (TIGR04325 family)